jgi:syringomycin synthetase protein SyrE
MISGKPGVNAGDLSAMEKREFLARLLAKEALRARSAPLSFSQQRLWLLDQIEAGNPAYNVPQNLRLTGALDVPILERALAEIARRHDALRTNVRLVDGVPVQVVAPSFAARLETIDLGERPREELDSALESLAVAEARKSFDLARDPMFRASLVRLGSAEHALLLTFHHIAVDGWSVAVFFDELAALYNAFRAASPSPLPELPIQYGDFAAWQRERAERDEDLEYWRSRLAGAPPLITLPLDRPRPRQQTYEGAAIVRALPRSLADAVASVARDEGATQFMVLLAALKATFVRHGCGEDIVIGMPIAGRARPELEQLIGFFVNTLPLRTDCSGDPTFSELLARVKETTLGAFEHQDVQFERIVEIARPPRLPGVNPLLQMLFVMQSATRELPAFDGLRIERIHVDNRTSKFDISISITPEPSGYELRCEYSRALFDEATIELLLADYCTLLATVAASPGTRLSALATSRAQAGTAAGGSAAQNPAPQTSARPAPNGSRPPRDPLEQSIADIWSRLLGRTSIGAEDDFFRLGGHSLLAARMVAEVERTCGTRVRWAALIESPTVAHLAEVVRSTRPAPSPIVAFNEGGKQPRFFFFHSDPFTGGVYCRRLAEQLGAEQPFYAVAPHGIDGVPLLPTIEAMALDYAERIAKIQPRGPYRLGGFCAGGLVAYELARVLSARGHAVQCVILVNSGAPNPRHTPLVDWYVRTIGLDPRLGPALREKLCRFAVGLRAAVSGGPLGVSRFTRRRMLPRPAAAPGTVDAFTDEAVVKQQGTPVVETSLAHIVAAYTYHPPAYDGPLTLIWGADQRDDGDPKLGWGSLAREVRVMRMPGGHLSLLRDSVDEVARAIGEILRA